MMDDLKDRVMTMEVRGTLWVMASDYLELEAQLAEARSDLGEVHALFEDGIEELQRILAEIREREGPPDDFDPRAAIAVWCCFIALVIALCGGVWVGFKTVF